MSEQTKRRNPYADTGLMIAVSVIIVMLIKTLLFGATWGSLIWGGFSIIYCFLSYKYNSESKLIKHSTTAFLALSLISFTSILFFDKKARPQMHAFEGAKKDSIDEAEFIIKEEPELPAITEDVNSESDTLIIAEDSLGAIVEGFGDNLEMPTNQEDDQPDDVQPEEAGTNNAENNL